MKNYAEGWTSGCNGLLYNDLFDIDSIRLDFWIHSVKTVDWHMKELMQLGYNWTVDIYSVNDDNQRLAQHDRNKYICIATITLWAIN